MRMKIVMFMISALLLFSMFAYADLSVNIFPIERVGTPFPTAKVSVIIDFSGNYYYSLSANNMKSNEERSSIPRPIKSELAGYSYNFGWDYYITTPDNRPHEIGLTFYRRVSGSGNSFSFVESGITLDGVAGWYTVYAGLSGQWEVHLISPSGERTVIIPETEYAQRTDFVEAYIPGMSKNHKNSEK